MVTSTLSGQVSITVSAEDAVGNAYSGSESLVYDLCALPELALVSSPNTSNQSWCSGQGSIEQIIYEYNEGGNVTFSWTGSETLFVSGITAVISGTNRLVIAGTPNVAVSTTTSFTYEVQTTGSACGSEVILSGVIVVEPTPEISIIQGSSVTTYCGIAQDLTGSNAIVLGYSNASALVVNPSTPLPNGLSFGLQPGSFDQYAITGQLNQTVTQTTIWEVEINSTGGNCNQASQTITFILSPQPEISLASQVNTDNQTLCVGKQ